MHFDARGWTEEDQDDARDIQQKLGIFAEPKPVYERVSEYPTVRLDGSLVHPVPPNPRNKPCPAEADQNSNTVTEGSENTICSDRGDPWRCALLPA
jgi:hypothetical protein